MPGQILCRCSVEYGSLACGLLRPHPYPVVVQVIVFVAEDAIVGVLFSWLVILFRLPLVVWFAQQLFSQGMGSFQHLGALADGPFLVNVADMQLAGGFGV